MKNMLRSAVLGALLATTAILPAMAQTPLYHLVAAVPLGGGIKWDYLRVDPARHWVYISHGTTETVVSLRTLKVVGELRGLDGSHGIVVDPATGLIWADSAKTNAAIAFNPKTFKPVASVPVLADADGMTYDAATKTIYVSGGDGQGFTPINPATRTADADIALGSSPESHIADGKGHLWVAMIDANAVDEIDTATRKIVATWPTTGCTQPTGLAFDAAKRLLFTSCRGGTMDVLNADTGAVVATLPIGMGTDSAAYDDVRHRAFSANGDGTLTVVDDSGAMPKLLATVPTEKGARTLAVDPATGDVYTVTAAVTGTAPSKKPGGKLHYTFAPGSLTLYVYAPSR